MNALLVKNARDEWEKKKNKDSELPYFDPTISKTVDEGYDYVYSWHLAPKDAPRMFDTVPKFMSTDMCHMSTGVIHSTCFLDGNAHAITAAYSGFVDDERTETHQHCLVFASTIIPRLNQKDVVIFSDLDKGGLAASQPFNFKNFYDYKHFCDVLGKKGKAGREAAKSYKVAYNSRTIAELNLAQ